MVRQMIHYAVRSGCRYGLLTDMHHLIVFRFVTEVVEREVCCGLVVQGSGRNPTCVLKVP